MENNKAIKRVKMGMNGLAGGKVRPTLTAEITGENVTAEECKELLRETIKGFKTVATEEGYILESK